MRQTFNASLKNGASYLLLKYAVKLVHSPLWAFLRRLAGFLILLTIRLTSWMDLLLALFVVPRLPTHILQFLYKSVFKVKSNHKWQNLLKSNEEGRKDE